MVCTTLEPVEAKEGLARNAQEEIKCYQVDISQFLRSVSPRHYIFLEVRVRLRLRVHSRSIS